MTSCWGADVIMMAVECYLRCWKLEGSKKQRDTFYVEPPSSSKLWAQFALLSKHIPAPISRAMAAMRWTSLVFLPVSWACSYVELPWQANSNCSAFIPHRSNHGAVQSVWYDRVQRRSGAKRRL